MQQNFYIDRTDFIKEWWEGEDGIIMKFKVFRPKQEKTLEDTVAAALKQIEERVIILWVEALKV